MTKNELRRWCPDCSRWFDFDLRIEGNISTGEQWEIIYCPVCKWIDEKKRTRCPVVQTKISD